ncbi:hypothetical protein EVAR_81204_1 [Eumeta japonica]|uniref:Uncharacterized protein n=1 Tax=Eumeta variegata TaxID=151549 RepID=A0A4C1V283_EUMVA|nr:hypothetical protein EVAR_81204_1 [Eumeta japonica]
MNSLSDNTRSAECPSDPHRRYVVRRCHDEGDSQCEFVFPELFPKQDADTWHSFLSLYHKPHSIDVVFGRRRRSTYLTQIIIQISEITFELVKPVLNATRDEASSWEANHSLNLSTGIEVESHLTTLILGLEKSSAQIVILASVAKSEDRETERRKNAERYLSVAK